MAVAALVLLPVLYALSVGPAVALYHNGMIGQSWEPALQVFYTPLEWCVELVPGAEPLFDRYMSLWETPSPVPMPVTTPAPAPAPYGS